MFQRLHQELLDFKLDVETKVLVVLVCTRFDGYSGEYARVCQTVVLWQHFSFQTSETDSRPRCGWSFQSNSTRWSSNRFPQATSPTDCKKRDQRHKYWSNWRRNRVHGLQTWSNIQKHDAAASRANVLRLDSRTKFQVFVKGFVTMTFDVDRNTTVAQLKSRLQVSYCFNLDNHE